MSRPASPLGRSLVAAVTVGVVAVALLALLGGFSARWPVRALEIAAVLGLGVVIIGAAVALALVNLAGWSQSDAQFDAVVDRSERLAVGDGRSQETFGRLVRAALATLPIECHRMLEHVEVVLDPVDGDGFVDAPASSHFREQIVLDSGVLIRDYGSDPATLVAGIAATVRIALAERVLR